MLYRGYKIVHNPSAPVTGRWRGERFGVGLCNGTKEELLRCIDRRLEEERLARQEAGDFLNNFNYVGSRHHY